MWRSHTDQLSYSEQENRALGDALAEAGGEVLLDQRIRCAGSHHQKLVVARHPGDPGRDVAFVGGIDLCRSRRDDADHHGDPQPLPMATAYGERPPWHDVQLELRGPAVAAARRRVPRALGGPALPRPAPPDRPDTRHARRRRPHRRPAPRSSPPAAGGRGRPGPGPADLPGDTAGLPLRAARRAVGGARVHQGLRTRAAPDLPRGPVHVVPAHRPAAGRRPAPQPTSCTSSSSCRATPTWTAASRSRPTRWAAARRSGSCRKAAPDRVHVFDLENHAGTPVYVHAKVCVIDDMWACVGSANLNRRSWTHDSELSCRRARRRA